MVDIEMVVSKFEINRLKGIFFMRDIDDRVKHYYPCGLNIRDKLWWRFMPGVVINVKWPKGQVKVGPSHRDGYSGYGPEYEYVDSADPNDHYRPWMEQHVGRQGWDWNWGMADRDATDNRLTIKIRRKHARYATIAAMKWS